MKYIKTKNQLKTEIFSAIILGYINKVKNILDYGIDINTTDYKSDSLLIVAVKSGQLDIVRELIKRGANVNYAGLQKDTAVCIQ